MTLSNSSTSTAAIGVTGLAVMGSNIAQLRLSRLHRRAAQPLDRRTDALLIEHGSKGTFVRSETTIFENGGHSCGGDRGYGVDLDAVGGSWWTA
jgi:hypothetical protein